MNHTELSESDRVVLQSAIDAANRLYIPGIQEVGAALRTTAGQIFAAIHFETATGFANVCGEVAAICCMVAAGHRDVETVAAVWRDPNGNHYLLPPCGRRIWGSWRLVTPCAIVLRRISWKRARISGRSRSCSVTRT